MALFDMVLAPFRRTPRRPLAARRPDRAHMGQTRSVPLGMEATDVRLVNQVNRRNDALERVNALRTSDTKDETFFALSSTHVDAMPEDETYAARFFRAFQTKGN